MDSFSKRLKRLDGLSFSFDFLADEDGYLDRQCPDSGCRYEFKIDAEVWEAIEEGAIVYCPLCRHEDSSDAWVSENQVAQAQEQIGELVVAEIGSAIVDSLAESFGGSRSGGRSGARTTVTATRKPLRSSSRRPLQPAGAMDLKIQCESCSAQFAVVGAAYFCPRCGHESVIRTFDDSLGKVETLLGQRERIKHSLREAVELDEAESVGRSLAESGLGDCVAAFQHFAACLFERYGGGAVGGTVFQRIDDGSQHWEKQCGRGYDHWLTLQELENLKRLFQQRHLLEHNGGRVDEKYLKRSEDKSYDLGQRVVVQREDVLSLVGILRKLAAGLQSLSAGETQSKNSDPGHKEKEITREGASPWSDDEIRLMAEAVYADRRPRCPACRAPIRGRQLLILGRTTSPVMLHCERCGQHGQFDPADEIEKPIPFKADEDQQIVEDYWHGRRVLCPRDGAVLVVNESSRINRPKSFRAHCPRCGASLSPQDVEATR